MNTDYLIPVGWARTTFRSTPPTHAAGDVAKLSRRISLQLTAAPSFHGCPAFAAMQTAAPCAAMRQLQEIWAMAKATHPVISAACYFLIPPALCAGLVVVGTFTGYVFITNLVISIVGLGGLLVALFLIMSRKSHTEALMLIVSVSFVGIWLWHFGEDSIRRYLYVAEVMVTPHFDKKCVPPDGILFNGDTLRLCSTNDFGDYADLIVKISGSYPIERLIDDINSRKIDPRAGGDELMKLGIWLNSVIGRHLVSDYYLFKVYECGKGQPFCGPLQ